MAAKTPAKGTTAKHARVHKAHRASAKHAPTKHKKPVTSGHAHHVHAAAHGAKPAKPRGLALDGLPVCGLEAVAMSLRLAGQPVDGDEVAWLWELAGGRELSIPEALEAAARFGLAGCRPVLGQAHGDALFDPGHADALPVGIGLADLGGCDVLQPVVAGGAAGEFGRDLKAIQGDIRGDRLVEFGHAASFHALILGISRPGPHAVLATPDGWWSWGELRDPWDCRIEEAWEVSWHA